MTELNEQEYGFLTGYANGEGWQGAVQFKQKEIKIRQFQSFYFKKGVFQNKRFIRKTASGAPFITFINKNSPKAAKKNRCRCFSKSIGIR